MTSLSSSETFADTFFSGVSPRFPADVHSLARRKSFALSDLDAEVICRESFQTDFEREAGGTLALAATLKDVVKSKGGDG